MDKRKKYYLILDTETANGLDDALVYDIGYAIIDKKGTVYHTESLLVYDIFVGERKMMKSAYYAEKIPMYEKQYKAKERKLVQFSTAKKLINDICKEWNVSAIIAHNARFDYSSLNTTQRYLTSSKARYFLPYGIPIWCTLSMARDTIAKQKSYLAFCQEKPEERLTKFGKVRMTAEILYQYIIDDGNFKEEHTGLSDVLIEKEIFARCMRQNKKMKKSPWKSEKKENVIFTEIQRRVNNIVHYQTV